jgi:hypothetical protein
LTHAPDHSADKEDSGMPGGENPGMNINRIGITLGQLFAWLTDHPSTLAVGALVIAALLAAPPLRENPPQADPGEAGDVALFI